MIVSAVMIYIITIINDLAARTRSRVQRKRAGCRVIDDCGAAYLNDFYTKTERTMNIGMRENDRERSPQKRNVIMVIMIFMYYFSRYHVIIIILLYYHLYCTHKSK